MVVIDLTADSPDEGPRNEQTSSIRKRQRSPEPVSLEAAEEAAARNRIMLHARRVNLQRGIALEAPPAQQQPLAAAEAAVPADDGGDSLPFVDMPVVVAAPGVPSPQASMNQLLAQLHAERTARQAERMRHCHGMSGPAGAQGHQTAVDHRQDAAPAHPEQQQQQQAGATELRLLTYNVWFREDVHVEQRMQAIGDIIAAKHPHFICLQEVTPLIWHLLSNSPWRAAYSSSPIPSQPYFTVLMWHTSVQCAAGCAELPFENSMMGRDLKTVAGSVAGRSVRVATTHLESPTGWDQPHSQARVAQCRQALGVLDRAKEGDVLFAGDMNWNPDDGSPPLPGGWSDAWLHLHNGDPGMTYDVKANPMLKGRLRRRLDRIFVRLKRWRLHHMEMVGTEPLPGLKFEGRPVLPSDHFGLLLSLRPKE